MWIKFVRYFQRGCILTIPAEKINHFLHDHYLASTGEFREDTALLFCARFSVRYLYTFLFYLATPFIFLKLWWRSRREPAYRERLAERLGYYPFKLEKCVWLHAVSMGETLAAIPLIKALQARYPQWPMLVTSMTPTGAAQVAKTFGDTVKHAYLPYDLPGAVNRFLNTMHPTVAVIMETELWPNLISACRHKNIPICLVNARLSAKSAKGYQCVSSITHEMLQKINAIAAHGKVDADRFIALGAPASRMQVTGNLKFDLQLPADLTAKAHALRQTLGADRFVWIAASTHEGEEEIILAAHKKIREIDSQALLVLVPRHPARFDEIANLCMQSFTVARRSQQQPCTKETAVYLGDTMGELLVMYGAADVTFVGGSLIPRGGHNMLEPGALEKPILSGPHLFNFAEISELFVNANAMIKVTEADALAEQVLMLMQDATRRAEMGARALGVVAANRGALAKQMVVIEKLVPDINCR